VLRGLVTMSFPRNAFFYRGEVHTVDYPPLSMFLLWLTGRLYVLLVPDESNGPLFNALVNFPPLLASIALTLLLKRSASGDLGTRRALAFWLNPALLLGAILGYQDAIFGLFGVAAALALDGRRPALASACVITAGLLKPQGSLLLPTFLALLFFEYSYRTWIRAALAGLVTAAVILSPFWTTHHLLSALDGCRRPLEETTVSPESLNLGWIAGYLAQWVREKPWPLARILTLDELQAWTGVNPLVPSRILLGLGTLLNVALLLKRPREDRTRVPLSLILQAHIYALFGTAVHENHTFLAVFVAPLLLGAWKRGRAILALTSAFLFANLFLLEGLGRTLIPDRKLFRLRLLTGVDLSVLVALAHVALLILFLVWAMKRESASPSR
jgi:Gpi18-like mannosyltransferase